MKKLLFFFLLLSATGFSQNKRDTVQQGFYALVDSTCSSVCVTIKKPGDAMLHVTNVAGNKLPANLMHELVSLEKGSIVIYEEKARKPRSYIVGDHNTIPAERYQITTTVMSRQQIAFTMLDPNTISFDIDVPFRQIYLTKHINGNRLTPEVQNMIFGLRPGDCVVFENVKIRNADGTITTKSFSYVVGK